VDPKYFKQKRLLDFSRSQPSYIEFVNAKNIIFNFKSINSLLFEVVFDSTAIKCFATRILTFNFVKSTFIYISLFKLA